MVRQDIRGGASASEALTRHPGYFSELYVATIRAGEQSGNLVEVVKRFIGYLKLMIGLRQKVGKALAYPAFLVLTGVAVVGFLLSYVMPTFISVYTETAKSLPFATQLLIDVVSDCTSSPSPRCSSVSCCSAEPTTQQLMAACGWINCCCVHPSWGPSLSSITPFS
jgi:type IV pilus assembly protein PilC